jgi:hypothetical protein
MTMTKSTTIVWESRAAWEIPQFVAAKTAYFQEAIAAGKTDGSHDIEDPETELIWTRFWRDQAAAEEFIAFNSAQAAEFGAVIISSSIGDYIAPV